MNSGARQPRPIELTHRQGCIFVMSTGLACGSAIAEFGQQCRCPDTRAGVRALGGELQLCLRETPERCARLLQADPWVHHHAQHAPVRVSGRSHSHLGLAKSNRATIARRATPQEPAELQAVLQLAQLYESPWGRPEPPLIVDLLATLGPTPHRVEPRQGTPRAALAGVMSSGRASTSGSKSAP